MTTSTNSPAVRKSIRRHIQKRHPGTIVISPQPGIAGDISFEQAEGRALRRPPPRVRFITAQRLS